MLQRHTDSLWHAELQGSPGASALLAAFLEENVLDKQTASLL